MAINPSNHTALLDFNVQAACSGAGIWGVSPWAKIKPTLYNNLHQFFTFDKSLKTSRA
jgi:hypothetical protein